jgi:hypothetical protein
VCSRVRVWLSGLFEDGPFIVPDNDIDLDVDESSQVSGGAYVDMDITEQDQGPIDLTDLPSSPAKPTASQRRLYHPQQPWWAAIHEDSFLDRTFT